jgi:hypothetical protein
MIWIICKVTLLRDLACRQAESSGSMCDNTVNEAPIVMGRMQTKLQMKSGDLIRRLLLYESEHMTSTHATCNQNLRVTER